MGAANKARFGVAAMSAAGLLLMIASTVVMAQPATQPAEPDRTDEALSDAAAPDSVQEEMLDLNSPDSVDQDLADAAARPAGLLKYGPVSLIDPLWKKFNEKTSEFGLKVGLADTIVYQAASGGPGDRDAAGNDFDLFGDWRLLGAKDGLNNGYLYFAAESRSTVCTEIAPNQLDTEIGSAWGTTNGFGTQDFTLKELYWQQHFGRERTIIRVGKLDPENYYNSNYWQSDSKYFMNQAFSSFPVRAFPGQGLGANITFKPSEDWYISAGAQDAQGVKTEAGFDTFFEDFNLFYAAEVGLTPTINGWGLGTYRFTAWYRDAGESNGQPHDAGFDISFDQRVGEHVIPFFRYGVGEGNINGIDQMVSAGVGWQGDLITQSDVIGFGAAWGQPSNDDLDDQYAAELFYRLQVSPDNQFTVGYQVIIDPVNNPEQDVVGVFEMRWRIAM